MNLYAQLILNPFSFDAEALPDYLQETFCDFLSDSSLEESFEHPNIEAFWCALPTKYEEIQKYVLTLLLPFPTTYLAECSFSALVTIKNSKRNRIDSKIPLMVALSKIEPRFTILAAKGE